jgi:hypothetical protein
VGHAARGHHSRQQAGSGHHRPRPASEPASPDGEPASPRAKRAAASDGTTPERRGQGSASEERLDPPPCPPARPSHARPGRAERGASLANGGWCRSGVWSTAQQDADPRPSQSENERAGQANGVSEAASVRAGLGRITGLEPEAAGAKPGRESPRQVGARAETPQRVKA